MRRARATTQSQGQGLVEFALLLPVLLLILFGLFDFGRAIFAYNTVSNAAREGARIAIVDQTLVGGIPVAAAEAASQATALGLDPSDPADVRVQYLMPEASPITPCPSRGLGCIAEVRVQYQFQAITPVIGSLIGPINLSSTTQIPIENTKP